jgi:aspartyl-tRNA(Asn)/glutamyl-tRNA(Gln) amidotransferase subunit A
MFPQKKYSYAASREKKLTAAIPDNFAFDAGEDFAKNFIVKKIHLEYFDVYKEVMYILACAEISNNINRYDGVKFGYRAEGYKNLEELYLKSRTEGFGPDAKLAAIMGAMVLSENNYAPLYEKAMKIRRLVKESLRFDEYDFLVLPTVPQTSGATTYDNLALYAPTALAGLPAITFSRHGAGIQLVAAAKNENALYSAWESAK